VTPPAQPLLILADTYKQAQAYAWDHDLGREGRAWVYIREPYKLYGQRDGKYILLTIPGHHRSPREIQERLKMLDILRTHGFTSVEEP